jgi:hypothetical protein
MPLRPLSRFPHLYFFLVPEASQEGDRSDDPDYLLLKGWLFPEPEKNLAAVKPGKRRRPKGRRPSPSSAGAARKSCGVSAGPFFRS